LSGVYGAGIWLAIEVSLTIRGIYRRVVQGVVNFLLWTLHSSTTNENQIIDSEYHQVLRSIGKDIQTSESFKSHGVRTHVDMYLYGLFYGTVLLVLLSIVVTVKYAPISIKKFIRSRRQSSSISKTTLFMDDDVVRGRRESFSEEEEAYDNEQDSDHHVLSNDHGDLGPLSEYLNDSDKDG
jgi:hypothetical protein